MIMLSMILPDFFQLILTLPSWEYVMGVNAANVTALLRV
jgi:hypothetical protein